MSIGIRIKSEYLKFKDNIKYRLNTSPKQKLYDEIEEIYDLATKQVSQARIPENINKDTVAVNSIYLENFNSKFVFFNPLFRAEIEVKETSKKKTMSLKILNDYVLEEFKDNIRYSFNDIGVNQKNYNLSFVAKLNAIAIIKEELEKILYNIKIYRAINYKNELNYLVQQNEVEKITKEKKFNSISIEDVLVETKLEFKEETASTIDDNKNNTIFKQDKFDVELFEIMNNNNIIDDANIWMGLGENYDTLKIQFIVFLIVIRNINFLKNKVSVPVQIDFFKARFRDFKAPSPQHYSEIYLKLFDKYIKDKEPEINVESNYYDTYIKFLELLQEN